MNWTTMLHHIVVIVIEYELLKGDDPSHLRCLENHFLPDGANRTRSPFSMKNPGTNLRT